MTRSRLDALICEQEHLETLTRKEIETVQLFKLNRLLLREKKRAGFYRNLPEHLNQLSELASLPFTTEADLSRNAPSLLLTSQRDISRILSDATSGTTGLPKRVFYTDGDLENTVQLYMAGLGELIFPGNTAMICFPFSGPNGLGELIAEAVTRLGAKPLKLGTSCTYGELNSVLGAALPEVYVGMPVPFLGLLRTCGRKSLRRALVSGDACPWGWPVLSPAQHTVVCICGKITSLPRSSLRMASPFQLVKRGNWLSRQSAWKRCPLSGIRPVIIPVFSPAPARAEVRRCASIGFGAKAPLSVCPASMRLCSLSRKLLITELRKMESQFSLPCSRQKQLMRILSHQLWKLLFLICRLPSPLKKFLRRTPPCTGVSGFYSRHKQTICPFFTYPPIWFMLRPAWLLS